MGATGGSRRRVDRAIRILRRAARADPSPRTNMPRYAGNLANALRQRYAITRHAGDRDAAIELYHRACTEGLEAATGVAFYAARDWAGWAATRRAWTEAVAASESGLRAMERLLLVQIARRDQEAWLREAQAVPALAGYAYAGAGDREGAVTAIERGRAVLWAGAVPGLDRLGRPDLVERYRKVAARLAPVRGTSGPEPQ